MRLDPSPALTRRMWLAATLASASGLAAASLSDVIARVKPSVVIVGTYNALDSPRFKLAGTGFVVDDGTLVVTNAHVLNDAATAAEGEPGTRQAVGVFRGGRDWEMRPATLVTVDRSRDLALLRISGPPVPAMTLADPASVREGQSIAFTGFPIGGVLGYAPVTHRGIVSSITTIALPAPQSSQLSDRAVRRLTEGNFEVYQLDAVAYPGNSGGPVFDAGTGEVIGVINMVLVKGTRESALSSPTGLTYAIPVRFVKDLLERR